MSLSSSALFTLARTRVEVPRRRRKPAAIGIAVAMFTLAAIDAWPSTPEAASRPMPRAAVPMLVRLDPETRPVAPPPPLAPLPPPMPFDRYDPGDQPPRQPSETFTFAF